MSSIDYVALRGGPRFRLTDYARLNANGEPASPHERIIDMRSAMNDANVPLPYRVRPLAIDGHVTLLVGRPGESKTWLAMLAASGVQAGEDFAGIGCTQGTALYLDAENGARLLGRRFLLLGLDHDAFTVATGMGLRLPQQMGVVGELVKATSANLLVLDSLRRLAPGIREDKSDDVAPLMAALSQLAHETRAAVIVIHHRSTKPHAPDVRGSSALEDQADIVWGLGKAPGDPQRATRRKLRNLKMRPDEEHAPIWLDFRKRAGFMAVEEAAAFEEPAKGEDVLGRPRRSWPSESVRSSRRSRPTAAGRRPGWQPPAAPHSRAAPSNAHSVSCWERANGTAVDTGNRAGSSPTLNRANRANP